MKPASRIPLISLAAGAAFAQTEPVSRLPQKDNEGVKAMHIPLVVALDLVLAVTAGAQLDKAEGIYRTLSSAPRAPSGYGGRTRTLLNMVVALKW